MNLICWHMAKCACCLPNMLNLTSRSLLGKSISVCVTHPHRTYTIYPIKRCFQIPQSKIKLRTCNKIARHPLTLAIPHLKIIHLRSQWWIKTEKWNNRARAAQSASQGRLNSPCAYIYVCVFIYWVAISILIHHVALQAIKEYTPLERVFGISINLFGAL